MIGDTLPEVADQVPGRVLIIDDVADNRAVLARRFQRRGFVTAEADSGADALAQVAAGGFDVVLLDVVMPDMDGLEVLSRIRVEHSPDELPVIMVTGKTQSEDVVKALSLGANDYITKPVDFPVALARVTTQVSRRRAETEARDAREALAAANAELEARIAERTAELLESNAQLREAITQAEAANKAKDQFLSTMSHELRTPLNGLVAMGSLLAQTQLDARQSKILATLNESSALLNGVVTDLLALLDLNSGHVRLTEEDAPLHELLEAAARPVRDKAAAKGLTLEIVNEAGTTARMDPQRLREVLGKLLDNAVKFTEAGGVRLSARRETGRLVIAVSDTGVGIEPEVADKILRPFEQADGSLTRRYGGLGLGLAIANALVCLMGGGIRVDSCPGNGATFTVDLPQPAA